MSIISHSGILNKSVLSVAGDYIGRVRDLSIDTRSSPPRVAALVLQGSAADPRRIVSWNRIRNVGRDAVMVDDAPRGPEAAAEIGSEQLRAPELRLIDKAVVREDGRHVGRIMDVRFDGSTGELVALEIAAEGLRGWMAKLNLGRLREIDVGEVRSVGADAVVIASAESPSVPAAPAAM